MSLLSTYLHFSQLYLLGIVFIFTLVLNIQTFDYELKPLSPFPLLLSLPAISLQKSPPEGSESVMKKLCSLFLSEIQTKCST